MYPKMANLKNNLPSIPDDMNMNIFIPDDAQKSKNNIILITPEEERIYKESISHEQERIYTELINLNNLATFTMIKLLGKCVGESILKQKEISDLVKELNKELKKEYCISFNLPKQNMIGQQKIPSEFYTFHFYTDFTQQDKKLLVIFIEQQAIIFERQIIELAKENNYKIPKQFFLTKEIKKELNNKTNIIAKKLFENKDYPNESKLLFYQCIYIYVYRELKGLILKCRIHDMIVMLENYHYTNQKMTSTDKKYATLTIKEIIKVVKKEEIIVPFGQIVEEYHCEIEVLTQKYIEHIKNISEDEYKIYIFNKLYIEYIEYASKALTF